MICFVPMPVLTYKFTNPGLEKTPEEKSTGRAGLVWTEPMGNTGKLVAAGFALAGWGACLLTGFNANAIGLVLIAFLFVAGAVQWKDVLGGKAAWDTVVWFGATIPLAAVLAKLAFIKWVATGFAANLAGLDRITTFIILGFAYIHLHNAFATAPGHVAAMYVPFATVAIAAGAPATMVTICLATFSNFMRGNTGYADGPGPVHFGQGCFERPRFHKINFCLATFCVFVVFPSGMLRWKAIGLY